MSKRSRCRVVKPRITSICLSMIVRNEAHVIKRCLDSVKPYITHWVIADTGSTDGTQDIIREHMAGLPGALHEHEWVNFGHNRNLALQLARTSGADYVMIIDADEWVEVNDPRALINLSAPLYLAWVVSQVHRYPREGFLLRASLPWRYFGVLHERVTCDAKVNMAPLPGVQLGTDHRGAHSGDPEHDAKDVVVLLKALEDEPDNAHYWSCLGQVYMALGEYRKSLEVFERFVKMPGGDVHLVQRLTAPFVIQLLKAELAKAEGVRQ